MKNSTPKKKTKAPKGKSPKKPKKVFKQRLFRDWCKGCGLCSAFCPKKVIEQAEDGAPIFVRSEDCVGCRFCEFHCPDFAISILENGDPSEEAAS